MTAQLAAYGRIAADVQTKPTSNGSTMAFTRLAVSLPCREAEDGASVMWLGVTAFGKQADALAHHLKGDVISVSGVLQVRQWTGQNGDAQSGYSLLVDSVMSSKTVKTAGGRRSDNPTAQGNAHQPPPPADCGTPDDEPPF